MGTRCARDTFSCNVPPLCGPVGLIKFFVCITCTHYSCVITQGLGNTRQVHAHTCLFGICSDVGRHSTDNSAPIPVVCPDM